LSIASLNFGAVWLHGAADDIILPLDPPTFGRFKPSQPYSESQVIKILQPEAIQRKNSPGRFGAL